MESNSNELSIAEQAHNWFITLRDGNAGDRAAFANWLKASPRHVGEFLQVTAVYRQFSGVDLEGQIDVEALVAESAPNVVSLNGTAPHLRKAPIQRGALAAATLVISIALVWLLYAWTAERHSYENAVGEIRSFELDDGSVIHLNTRSKVQVHFDNKAREIWLASGEALFKVAHDPTRPFRVHVNNATVQALGTQFNVYRKDHATTVAVIEGSVRVYVDSTKDETKALVAGEGASIATDGKIATLAKLDTVQITAWQQRRLIFRNDTLAAIAAEFNRYNEKPRFRIEGEGTAAMRFTGVFDAEAPESFVRVLRGVGTVAAERHGDEVVIRETGASSKRAQQRQSAPHESAP